MELNLVMTILDRTKIETMENVIKSLDLPMTLTMLGRGTATTEVLSIYGLLPTEKAIVSTVADAEQTRKLMRAAKLRMYIDVPGNGIMLAVPLKSIGGGRTMAYLTDHKPSGSNKPDMTFDHELIYVILNEGCSDLVMAAARPAGAGGGTVLTGKGTGAKKAEKFLGISLADEKDIVMIVAPAKKKAAIMQAIIKEAGPGTPAAAICFSLPVTQVAGLRTFDEEESAEAETPAAP